MVLNNDRHCSLDSSPKGCLYVVPMIVETFSFRVVTKILLPGAPPLRELSTCSHKFIVFSPNIVAQVGASYQQQVCEFFVVQLPAHGNQKTLSGGL